MLHLKFVTHTLLSKADYVPLNSKIATPSNLSYRTKNLSNANFPHIDAPWSYDGANVISWVIVPCRWDQSVRSGVNRKCRS